MIYLFTGDDAHKKKEAYQKRISCVSQGTEVFTIEHNNFNPVEIESFYSGQGLFFNTCVIVFQNILEKEYIRDFMLKKLEVISESSNDFVFLEGKLPKATIDMFRKVTKEIHLFESPKEKKEKFNTFLLANALAGTDKLNLWIYFRQAVEAGVGMEEIVGVLFWKVKDMITKKSFTKLSHEKLDEIACRLSCLLPEARKNGFDDAVAVEQFLLEVF
jgi:hypothetical protein